MTTSASRRTQAFPEEAFARLAALEEGHFWFRSRNRLVAWALGRYFAGARRLLEVGCGTGVVLRSVRARYPSLELVGVDLSEEALRIARGRVDADFVHCGAADVPFHDEFDVACAFDVLEHLDDDDGALRALHSAVRNGGGLLVMVPQYEWLWSASDDYGGHRRRYTKRTIEARVRHAGFDVIRSTAWVCTLLPLVAASRLLQRRAGGDYDPSREFRLAPALNRALERTLDAENRAIALGASFPFGSSRLLVARKA